MDKKGLIDNILDSIPGGETFQVICPHCLKKVTVNKRDYVYWINNIAPMDPSYPYCSTRCLMLEALRGQSE